MKPTHKSTVKSIIRSKGEWSGYIAPSNVNAYHIRNGWALGMPVKFTDIAEMEETLNSFAYYNCNDAETGYRIRFWED